MPNALFDKTIGKISAFASQAFRSGKYSATAARTRMVSRAVTAGATATGSTLKGAMGGMRSDLGALGRTASSMIGPRLKTMGFHAPGLIGAGVGAAYGGYNDATGRKGPGLLSGAMMGAAAGYGYRGFTAGREVMGSAAGKQFMNTARGNYSAAKHAYGRGYMGSVRQSLKDVRAGGKAARSWGAM